MNHQKRVKENEVYRKLFKKNQYMAEAWLIFFFKNDVGNPVIVNVIKKY